MDISSNDMDNSDMESDGDSSLGVQPLAASQNDTDSGLGGEVSRSSSVNSLPNPFIDTDSDSGSIPSRKAKTGRAVPLACSSDTDDDCDDVIITSVQSTQSKLSDISICGTTINENSSEVGGMEAVCEPILDDQYSIISNASS